MSSAKTGSGPHSNPDSTLQSAMESAKQSAMESETESSVESSVESSPDWVGIDHVQLAIPVGAEDEARAYYVDVLGLVEVPKPAAMAVRGGAWFEAGAVRVHVGAEDPFVPARKAHPALLLRNLRGFVETRGLEATWNDEIVDLVRCHVFDPFGNRIELIEA